MSFFDKAESCADREEEIRRKEREAALAEQEMIRLKELERLREVRTNCTAVIASMIYQKFMVLQ